MGSLTVVGIGPGPRGHLTAEAVRAIAEAEVVVGYHRYLSFIEPLIRGKVRFGSSMRQEIERADAALRAAREGKKVCAVADGDACVYGLGGLILERMTEEDLAAIDLSFVPGITAANAAGAVLGAPLMNDYVVLSLSDLLTDRQVILRRLHAAGAGDFVTALYNPRSRTRKDLLLVAREIFLEHRSGGTPVGIVRNALREGSAVHLCTLATLDRHVEEVDMSSIVIIGNSTSRRVGDYIVTPRGYGTKGDTDHEA